MKRLSIVAFLLILTGIFIASNIYTLIPIYESIAGDLSITKDQAMFGGSVFSIFYACGLLMFGPISEKVGRKKVIVSGLLFSCVTTGLVGFSFNAETLYIFRGIQGLALGSFAPVAFAYTFELFPIKQRTLILALINSGFIIAGILGQLISSSVTNLYGWKYVFYCFGLIYLGLYILGFIILPKNSISKRSVDRSIFKDMVSLLKKTSLLICYSITFSILLTFVSFYDGLGRFLLVEHNIDQQTLFTIRAIGLVGACLSLFTGTFVKILGDKKTLLLGLFLTASSLVLILLSSQPILIALFSITFVAALSLLYPSIISMIGTLGENSRGTAISLYSFILLTGASFGPILASLLDFRLLLISLICLFAINIGLSVKLKL